MPSLHDMQDIGNSRTRRRSDEADAVNQRGERAFAFRSEQPFRSELLFQLLERNLQRSNAFEFYARDQELILSTRLINRDVPFQNDLASIRQEVTARTGFIAKANAGKLRVGVFEGKIDVPGALRAQVGNLARD